MADYDDLGGDSDYDEYDGLVDPEDIGESVPPWRAIIDFPPYFIDRTIFWTGADGTMQQHDIIPPVDPSENDDTPPPPDLSPPPADYEQDEPEFPLRPTPMPSASIIIPLADLEFGAPRRPRYTDLREWLVHNEKANLVPVDLSGLAAVMLVSSPDTTLDNNPPASISPSSKVKYDLDAKFALIQSPEADSTTSMAFVKLDQDGNVTRLDRAPRRLDFENPLSEKELVRYEFMFRSAQQACRELATLLPEWLESLCQLRDVYESFSRDMKEAFKLKNTLTELHGYTQEQLSDVSPRLMEWFASSPIGCLDMYITKALSWISRLPSRTRSVDSEVGRITNISQEEFTTAGDYLQDLARKMIGLTIVVNSGWYGINDVKARVKHLKEHTQAERVPDELPEEHNGSLPDLVEAASETRL